MFITLLAVLAALSVASCPHNQHRNNHRKPEDSSSSSSSSSSSLPQQGVALTLDTGIYPFTFGKGNQGDFADQYFYFYVPQNSDPNVFYQLMVTDCYCGGDRFLVFDDFMNGQGSSEALSTCSNATPLCNVYFDDPRECVIRMSEFGFGQQDLCFTRLGLSQGTMHNITIQVATSPFGSGTGFVWLSTYNYANDRPVCYNQAPGGWEQCNLDVQDY